MTIGEALRLEREERGFSHADVAEGVGRGRDAASLVALWEGEGDPNAVLPSTLINLRRIGIDPLGRMVAAERGAPYEHTGIPIDRSDADGRPIRVGDWLRFDIREWGCGCAGPMHGEGCGGLFQITLSGGEIHGNGTPSDWSAFCRVIPKRPADVAPGRGEQRRAFLAPDAAWRVDPRGAAEAVTGWRWRIDGDGDMRLSSRGWGARLAGVTTGDCCWDVFSSPTSGIVVESECATWMEDGINAASAALVEAVIRGVITLPDDCPGLKALEDF